MRRFNSVSKQPSDVMLGPKYTNSFTFSNVSPAWVIAAGLLWLSRTLLFAVLMRSFNANLWSSATISPKTKDRVFIACVRSVLTCGCESWGLTQEQLRRVGSFEYLCLKRLGKFRPEHHISYDALYAYFNIKDSVSKFIQRRRLTWFGHVLRMDPNRIPHQLLWYHQQQPGWRRKPGRQKITWKRRLHKETRHLTNHVRYQRGNPTEWLATGTEWLNYVLELVQDRQQWRNIVSEIHHCQD